MNDLITLYIKTHNITGLKYFGKTKSKDPHKYKGSGVYWTNHIKKHGYDVTTEILGQFTDIVECKQFALQFSRDNDIVESKEWANLKPENGLDGGWSYINDNGLNVIPRELWSNQGVQNFFIGCVVGGIKSKELGLGIHELTTEQRKVNSVLAQEAVFEKYGVKSIFSILNKDPEFQENRKKVFKEIGHQQGKKNTQFGTKWTSIHNDITREKIRIEEGLSIPEGWELGWTFDLHLIKEAKEQKKNIKEANLKEYKYQKKIEYTKYLAIYEEFGFKKFVEMTGFQRTHSTFCIQLDQYLDDYTPLRHLKSPKERQIKK